MIEFKDIFIIVIISLSGGIAVATAITSFLIILDIIPRLAQVTKSQEYSFLYEIMLVLGVTVFSLLYLLPINFSGKNFYASIIGVFMGIFVGMLAAALTEVLNVVPIIVKRLYLEKAVVYVMLSIALGKVIGSLAYWLFPTIYQ